MTYTHAFIVAVSVVFLLSACGDSASTDAGKRDQEPHSRGQSSVYNLVPEQSAEVPQPKKDTELSDHRISAPTAWRDMDDDELAWLVIKQLWDWADFYGEYEPFREQLTELTPGQRAIYCTTWLDSEVKNGGFHQFFHNSTGMLGPEALQGFQDIGMEASARAVQAAFDYYKVDPYPRERSDRQLRLPDYEATKDERWTLDKSYYESTYDKTSGKMYDSILGRKQAAYIRAHPEEFFKP
jgi:hypothetical protein